MKRAILPFILLIAVVIDVNAKNVIRHNFDFELFRCIKKHASLSGFIVLENDTISGRMSFYYDNDTSLLPATLSGKRYSFPYFEIENNGLKQKIRISDPKLTYISVTDDAGSGLSVKKIANSFYRVIHTGKLSVYDHIYTFDNRNALRFFWENDDVILETSNGIESLRYKTAGDHQKRNYVNCKKHFINTVNKVYGTNFDAHKYKPRDLYALILKLG